MIAVLLREFAAITQLREVTVVAPELVTAPFARGSSARMQALPLPCTPAIARASTVGGVRRKNEEKNRLTRRDTTASTLPRSPRRLPAAGGWLTATVSGPPLVKPLRAA